MNDNFMSEVVVPNELIRDSWQRIENDLAKTYAHSLHVMMTEIVKARHQLGLEVPYHWEVDYGQAGTTAKAENTGGNTSE